MIKIKKNLSKTDKQTVREAIRSKLSAGEITMGEAVRSLRLMEGFTQAEYAQSIGIDLRVLADLEKGKGNPRMDSLQKIGGPLGLIITFQLSEEIL